MKPTACQVTVTTDLCRYCGASCYMCDICWVLWTPFVCGDNSYHCCCQCLEGCLPPGQQRATCWGGRLWSDSTSAECCGNLLWPHMSLAVHAESKYLQAHTKPLNLQTQAVNSNRKRGTKYWQNTNVSEFLICTKKKVTWFFAWNNIHMHSFFSPLKIYQTTYS